VTIGRRHAMASFRNLLLDDGNAVSHPQLSLAAQEGDTTRLGFSNLRSLLFAQ